MIDLIIIQNMLALASGVALATASIIKPLVDVLRRQFGLSGWHVVATVFALGQLVVWLIMIGVGVPLTPPNIALMLLAGILASQAAIGITHIQKLASPPAIVNNVVNVDLTEIYKVVKTAMQDYLNGDEFAGKE